VKDIAGERRSAAVVFLDAASSRQRRDLPEKTDRVRFNAMSEMVSGSSSGLAGRSNRFDPLRSDTLARAGVCERRGVRADPYTGPVMRALALSRRVEGVQ
jgi:hypothetical protein